MPNAGQATPLAHVLEHLQADLPVILAGPTAVGKTALSLALAETLQAEIISADSRQIYRRLDIGTAKPTAEERARVPHHFIDALDLGTPYSAGRFAEEAWARMAEIQSRGRRVLVVGGSTLYLHALEHGLAAIPAVASSVRQSLETRLAEEGASVLYAELARVDPDAAATMDATKTQRLVRALEVYHGTGRSLSHYHAQQPPPPYRFQVILLQRERSALYRRIELRVDQMLNAGLLDEVAGLREDGLDFSLNPLQTIGYQEPHAYLDGAIDYAEMVRLLKRNTRRYAKRQLTWWRRYDPYVLDLQ